MKKLICAASAALISAVAAFSFAGCGTAEVNFTLSEDGTYYILSGVTNGSALKNYDIPSTYGDDALPVKEIGDDAFANSTLYSVTIPDSVTVIGMRAFMGCRFTEIEIPDSVTSIKFGAFAKCSGLSEITVPSSVTYLGVKAFAYCTSLEKAYLKCNVEYLPDNLLANSVAQSGGYTYTETMLKEVYISSSVKRINKTAFEGNFITDVYFAGSEEDWNELYFYTYEAVEGQEEPNEVKVDKSAALAQTVVVHCNYNF
ncbi:MAG: leucine-rich repeat domain-containing protein [Candidatus Coproplasma sp.]